MPVIDPGAVPSRSGSSYPEPHASRMGNRSFREIGEAAGLTQFGAVIVTMPPGSLSSLRHWHSEEDEFALILSGTLTLVEDDGPVEVAAGTMIGWPKNTPNGHQLKNEGSETASFLVIGTRAAWDVCTYSDIDMKIETQNGQGDFSRKDGTPLG